MLPKLQISQSVISRLSLASLQQSAQAAVYGTMYDNTLLILGLSINSSRCGADPYIEMQTHFPTKVDFCGIVTFTDDTDDPLLSPDSLDVLKEVLVTDNPLVMKRAVNSCALRAYFYCNEKLVEVAHVVLSEADVCQRFVHVRLRTTLPLLCEVEPNAIKEAVNNLQKKVSSGTVAFHVPQAQLYLFGAELEESGVLVGELQDSLRTADSKKKPPTSLKDVEVVNVSLLHQSTRDSLSENTSRTAPVIQHLKCNKRLVRVELPIDHLAMVVRECHTAELYSVLVDTLCRSLRVFERCLSQGYKRLAVPRAYHFLPPDLGHLLTVVYLSDRSDDDLKSKREWFHDHLQLPRDRPIFRKGNVHVFKSDLTPNAPLVNPHEGLSPPLKDGSMSVVFGRYSYHHYMQDNFNDDGWGCAYRSLQTVVSWFRHQGYTDRAVPSHREIQQCLVDIGDKPSNFVGSRQWIGSTEVSFCLDTMLGVTCRILNVSSGQEMTEIVGTLADHFRKHGTPVMIGGGVLAHTILGVARDHSDLSQDQEDVRFLVLDPHYTGTEDLRTIQNKGWVGWKKPDFWKKTAFYNMCLPMRPQCF